MKNTIFANYESLPVISAISNLEEAIGGEKKYTQYFSDRINDFLEFLSLTCAYTLNGFQQVGKGFLVNKVTEKVKAGHSLDTAIAMVESRIKSDLYYLQISKPC